jgi:hypothetical protein
LRHILTHVFAPKGEPKVSKLNGLCFPVRLRSIENLRSPVLEHCQFCSERSASVGGLLSGRLTSSNEGMWVLFHHDSSAAPQTASPVCGTKNFVSVRLYSAPQLHRTIVAILGICPCGTPDQPVTRFRRAHE